MTGDPNVDIVIRFFGNSVGYNGTETITAMAFYTKSSPILTITPIQMPVQCDDSSFKTKMFCQSPDDFSQIKSGSVWISKYLRIGILQAIPTDGLGITIQLQLKPPSGRRIMYASKKYQTTFR
jgi:hypothetical protein